MSLIKGETPLTGWNFERFLDERLLFLATAGGSTFAGVAMKHFAMDGFVSNVDLFDDKSGRLTGVKQIITNGDQKLEEVLEMISPYNLRLANCMMIGAGDFDIPLLRFAGKAVASPYANENVKAIKGIELLRA
jgi:phosphoserine phosphatase